MREHKDQPFFLAVGFLKPHLPFVAPKKYWDLYDTKDIPLAANPQPPTGAPAFSSNDASELRRYKGVSKKGSPVTDAEAPRLIHGYLACVSYVDAQVGKLTAELGRLGLRDDTIVILWGDHGYHLGEQGTWNKRTNWEVATRVPLILSAPGQATGAKSDALVEFVDIYPTLAELCGLTVPQSVDGASFAPLLSEPDRPWKRAAFSIYQKKIPELGDGFGRAMRTDRYRLIEWSVDGSDRRVYELYDHQNDPNEKVNVANRPENSALVASLARQLREGWPRALP